MLIVIELQTNSEGVTSCITTSFEDRNKAESKFHQILMYASESTVPIHAASIMNERGEVERSEFYRHTEPPAEADSE